MRKTILLSAAALVLAVPGAFAQGPAAGATGAATPMATPSQTPAETSTSAMPMDKMPMGHGKMHGQMHKGMGMHHGMTGMHHSMKGMHQGMAMGETAAPAMDGEIRPGHEPGVGDSFPASDKASNITAGTTRSTIAPRLPVPAGGANASPAMFLQDAQRALDARQSGRAQEALERAETAMLQRSVRPDEAGTPDQQGGVMQVQMARDALAKGDMAGARKAIAAAMSAG